jgi:hypothetical protein
MEGPEITGSVIVRIFLGDTSGVALPLLVLLSTGLVSRASAWRETDVQLRLRGLTDAPAESSDNVVA